jgi:hypothetical protein
MHQQTLLALTLVCLGHVLAAQRADDMVEISMRRTCWGECRRYDLTLRRAGWASYEGFNSLPRIARSRAAIDSASFRRLAQFLADSGVFALDTAYVMPGDDMLRTTLCVRGAAFTRCVRHDLFTGPSALRAMEDAVDSVAAHLTWAPARVP